MSEIARNAYWCRFFADDAKPNAWDNSIADRFFCTGEREKAPRLIMCVLVHAPSQEAAWTRIEALYPEAVEDSTKQEDSLEWRPGNRFPGLLPLVADAP